MTDRAKAFDVAPAAGGSASSAHTRDLPDVNAETYPYDVVQHLLDQTAGFSWFAVPDREYAATGTLTPENPADWFGLNGGYGIAFRSALHRFSSLVQPPSFETGVRAAQTVGEAEGELRATILFGTQELQWAPGRNPPLAIFDPWEQRRFTLEADFVLGHGKGFHGYGLGRTYPICVHGQQRLLIGALGNLVSGTGQFADLEASFVLTGTVTDLGFLGQLTCRAHDPRGLFHSEIEISSTRSAGSPAAGSTFLVLRGVKHDRTVKTTYGVPPDARRVSLITPSDMRQVDLRSAQRSDSWSTRTWVGPVVGSMAATVFFDLMRPPGTATAPVFFSTSELYTFQDASGQTVGTLTAGIEDGISFKLELPAAPGQPAVRFAGFGPITGGTGSFAGVQGMLTVNSLIGISPHALSLVHVLHLVDPDGRFRAMCAEA
jgi:hypothetical protein